MTVRRKGIPVGKELGTFEMMTLSGYGRAKRRKPYSDIGCFCGYGKSRKRGKYGILPRGSECDTMSKYGSKHRCSEYTLPGPYSVPARQGGVKRDCKWTKGGKCVRRRATKRR